MSSGGAARCKRMLLYDSHLTGETEVGKGDVTGCIARGPWALQPPSCITSENVDYILFFKIEIIGLNFGKVIHVPVKEFF